MNGDLQAIRLIGGILPAALLGRIQSGEVSDSSSLSSSSFHLVGREQPKDAAARAWSYLRGAWAAWREDAGQVDGAGTGPAREKWLLVLLDQLGYGRLPLAGAAAQIDGTEYPISHRWHHVPIHLLGPGVQLDKRNPGVPGAARAPQTMVQEYLNRSDDDLWGILSNGIRLRLLRDSTAFAGSAYVEFDLEAIFDGELYAEFQLLWLLCHVSRLEKRGGPDASPADCWLEAWRSEAAEAGTRALNDLRDGVEQALTTLGSGFLAHRQNGWLRDALHNGALSEREYHKALLRLIYRLLFAFVAEDRQALLDPNAPREARERYAGYFSTARLRRLSRLRTGTSHPDLWRSLRMVFGALGGDGLPQLGIPALGGLFDPDDRAPRIDGAPHRDLLLGAELSNSVLLKAFRYLGWISKGQRVQAIDYQHLGAEELGGVYESLLELVPGVEVESREFTLEHLSGNERKTTGSYYTPPSLVAALLDASLDPVLDEAVKSGTTLEERERNLLDVTVCDPASGSGGFLVAAARRIARRLAQVRSEGDEPTPDAVQHALHEVVARCIYGVDMNDLAAELAKVSLWLEALEPGKPLGFLDARIRIGNSLFGATPALIEKGVPDGAFKEFEGDDRKYAAEVRKRNKGEQKGQQVLSFADPSALADQNRRDRERMLAPSDDVADIRARTRQWEEYLGSDARRALKRQADAWAAAFLWPLRRDEPLPPTSGLVFSLLDDSTATAYADTVDRVNVLSQEYRLFHWHLEFPEIFEGAEGDELGADGWAGGFSCMLGNPPWEQVEVDELEFFGGIDESIASERNAVRRRDMIEALASSHPPLFARYAEARQRSRAEAAFLRQSGAFALSSTGRVNRYRVFAELFTRLVSASGRAGLVAQTGIVTDKSSAGLVNNWTETGRFDTVCDFVNRRRIFPAVKPPVRFCLLSLAPTATRKSVRLAVMLDDVAQVEDDSRWIHVKYDLMRAMNPETGLLPMLSNHIDIELAEASYLRAVSLNEFGVQTRQGAINLSSGADELVRLTDIDQSERGTFVPVLESKLTDFYNFSAATFDGVPVERMYNKKAVPRRESVSDLGTLPTTRYYVSPENAKKRWPSKRKWVLAGKETTDAKTSSRGSVFCAIPYCCPAYTLQLVFDDESSIQRLLFLLGILNSVPFDYFARQKLSGSHLTAVILRQLPIPSISAKKSQLIDIITAQALALSASCDPLVEEARSAGLSIDTSVNTEDARAAIDAAAALLYGMDRLALEHVVESFTILHRIEVERHGEYRTKRLILENYDRMQHCMDTGIEFVATLTPPPGEGPRHPERSSDE